ncbi:MAG: imidazole glycerol phosphate synthase subunit HisF [Bdellovibrio sp.]
MRSVRVIARLDIKGPNLIKGVQLEGLRVIGDPQEYSVKYYHEGIDELLFMDVVASLYGRNNLSDIISRAADNVFVPITVGGGIRSIEDAAHILRSGADKVAINTAAIANPHLISDIANKFGSQCMVLSVEAKKVEEGRWEVFTDNGREKTGIDVMEWVQRGVKLGAGEVLLTSVDKEGTRKGFDLGLLNAVAKLVKVPLIASGGMGNLEHVKEALGAGSIDAIAVADALHYKRFSVREIKQAIADTGCKVR